MNIERDYPICLTSLTNSGIGKRKAKRMIRYAVFTLHRDGIGWSVCDSRPWDFCYHYEQGKYFKEWQHATFG